MSYKGLSFRIYVHIYPCKDLDMNAHSIASVFAIAKNWSKPKCLYTGEQINKL